MRYTAENMYKSCFRKARFKKEADAKKRAEMYHQRIYFCPICGAYHLTSKGVDNANK